MRGADVSRETQGNRLAAPRPIEPLERSVRIPEASSGRSPFNSERHRAASSRGRRFHQELPRSNAGTTARNRGKQRGSPEEQHEPIGIRSLSCCPWKLRHNEETRGATIQRFVDLTGLDAVRRSLGTAVASSNTSHGCISPTVDVLELNAADDRSSCLRSWRDRGGTPMGWFAEGSRCRVTYRSIRDRVPSR